MLSTDSTSPSKVDNSDKVIIDVAKSSKLDPYSDLIILQKLSDYTHPVFLARSSSSQKTLAAKMFSDPDDFNAGFMNHVRFMKLKHKNIITSLGCLERADIYYNNKVQNVGILIMEYAPYHDFHDLIFQKKLQFDDKLSRTFFRHMILGLQYLHSNEIAHLNLRPSNLLLGEDLQLKIANFTNAYSIGDVFIQDKNSNNYRAPELQLQNFKAPAVADVYAAGIILFLMKSGGHFPFASTNGNIDMFSLLHNDPETFWNLHESEKGTAANYYDKEFRTLFTQMTRDNPSDRATIGEIILSDWYNKEIYEPEELRQLMQEHRREL
jgi:Serine/threonine protein kinase